MNVVAWCWTYVKAILSDIDHDNLKILSIFNIHPHPMSSLPRHILDLLAVFLNPKLCNIYNHTIASMITRVVLCKGEWLWVVQWKSFESKIRNAMQSVDHWLSAMYCETIAENKRCHRNIWRCICVKCLLIKASNPECELAISLWMFMLAQTKECAFPALNDNLNIRSVQTWCLW